MPNYLEMSICLTYICAFNDAKLRQKMTTYKKQIKYPENREILKKLISGDRYKIAQKSGKAYRTICDVLSGYRRLKPDVLKAIKEVIAENEKFKAEITELSK